MQSVIFVLQKFWSYLSVALPGLIKDLINKAIKNEGDQEELKNLNEMSIVEELKHFYDSLSYPEVTFKVFLLRVAQFGWERNEAAFTRADSNDLVVLFVGHSYSHAELYYSYRERAVSLPVFSKRLSHYKWDVMKALMDKGRPTVVKQESDI